MTAKNRRATALDRFGRIQDEGARIEEIPTLYVEPAPEDWATSPIVWEPGHMSPDPEIEQGYFLEEDFDPDFEDEDSDECWGDPLFESYY